MVSVIQIRGAGVASSATWNPADKSTNITLSNGNLTAAIVTPPTDSGVRTTKVIASKSYFETPFPGLGAVVGAANASAPLDGAFLGADANGIGVQSNGTIFSNFTLVGTITAGTSSDTLGIAIDPAAHLFWARLNGGQWNGSGAANPATGTGGIDISVIVGALYSMVTLETAPLTANFGASAYAFTPPAGFGNIN